MAVNQIEHKFAAEHITTDKAALKKKMEEKSKKFVEKDAEVCAKA